MANQTDSFISEVTDEVRRDRLFAIFRKYGWIGVVAVIGIVGGAAVYEWQKLQQGQNAQAFGDQLMAALQADQPGQMLQVIPATGTQAALVRLSTAAQAVQDGNPADVLAALQPVATDMALPANLRDLAALKMVIAAGSQMPVLDRDALLVRLAAPGAPYRLMALEQQAVLALGNGDRVTALDRAREILADAGATPGLQQRATELMVALGEEPDIPAPVVAE